VISIFLSFKEVWSRKKTGDVDGWRRNRTEKSP
jgi:hypothetical protein